MLSAGETLYVFHPIPAYVCKHRKGQEDHTGPSVAVAPPSQLPLDGGAMGHMQSSEPSWVGSDPG